MGLESLLQTTSCEQTADCNLLLRGQLQFSQLRAITSSQLLESPMCVSLRGIHGDCDSAKIGEYSKACIREIKDGPVDTMTSLDRQIPGFMNWPTTEDIDEDARYLISGSNEYHEINPHVETARWKYAKIKRQNCNFGKASCCAVHNG